MGIHRVLTHLMNSNVVRVDVPEPIGTVFRSASSVLAQAVSAREQLGLNIVQAKDHAESFLMLNTGRASAFMEDDILLAGLKATSPNPNALAFLPDGYAKIYYGLMFTKGDAGFKALVDDVLSRQMASGQFEKTYAKWFNSPIPPKGENLAFPLTDALKERIAHPSDAVD